MEKEQRPRWSSLERQGCLPRPGDAPGVGPVRCVLPRPRGKVEVGWGPPLGGDSCVLGLPGLVHWEAHLGGQACVPGSPGWHSGLSVSVEIRPDCAGAAGGPEAGAGLPPVPPEPEQRGFQRHRLPALLVLPGVPAEPRQSWLHAGLRERLFQLEVLRGLPHLGQDVPGGDQGGGRAGGGGVPAGDQCG